MMLLRPVCLRSRSAAVVCGAFLASWAAAPCSFGQDLASSFSSLSEGLKTGTAGIRASGAPALAAAVQDDARAKYQDTANAFKGMGAMPDPAEMVGWGGIWNLELAACETSVVYSSSGLVWNNGKKANLQFTQEFVWSENPYANGAAVFRVEENGVRVSRFSRLNGDPPAVALDLQKPSEFTTIYDAGLGGKAVKSYACRSNQEDRILCRVEVKEYAVVPIPGSRTFYLGLRRAKS
ncbi:MAG: hypothetical protein WC943_09290 [Elusimicrobiota bacterium]|jgi:hypothetical protein